jgi:hypothetical protein
MAGSISALAISLQRGVSAVAGRCILTYIAAASFALLIICQSETNY